MSFRKMVIVPYQVMEDVYRWKTEKTQRPRLPPDPKITATANLQNQMSSVLNNDDLSETEKSQQFGETLQKFQLAHKKALGETRPKLMLNNAKTEDTDDDQNRILESVPITMRRRAKLLLNVLKNHPTLTWDKQGVVSVDGKPIPGSNIIDLVNDALRQRKGFEPKGWEHFFQGLREVNVPQDYIGNKKRWTWLQKKRKLSSPDTDEEEDDTTDAFETPRLPKKTPKTTRKSFKIKSIKKIKFSPKRQLASGDWEVWQCYHYEKVGKCLTQTVLHSQK